MSEISRLMIRGVIVGVLGCLGVLAGVIYSHSLATGGQPQPDAATESRPVAAKREANAATTKEWPLATTVYRPVDNAPLPAKDTSPLANRIEWPSQSTPLSHEIGQETGEINEPAAPGAAPLASGTVVAGQAFAGDPFGVGKLDIIIGDDLDIRWRPDEPLFLHEASNRTRYPAFVTSYRIAGEETTPHLRQLTVFYLFRESEPLGLSVKTASAEVTKVQCVPVVVGQESYRQLQNEWWTSYSSDVSALRGPQRQVKEYLVRMLGRRLDLPPPPRSAKPASEQPMAELERQFERGVSTLFGIDSVLLAMQDDVLFQDSGHEEIADQPLPAPVNVRPVRLPTMPANVPVESIALRVPQECFYVRCQRLANYIWLRRFVMHWGGSLHEIVSTSALDYQIRQTMERQLALSPKASQELLIDETLADMALIGCDLFFRDGAAVGVLFEAKDGDRLNSIIQQQRASVKRVNPSAEQKTVYIENRAVSLLSTSDNVVRSFHVVDGNYHLVTNSHYIAGRFLQTGDRQGGLGQLNEFRYARTKDQSNRNTPIWIYLSDPFFRKLTSPQYRIEMRRRARALAELKQLRLAGLVAASEGNSVDSLRILMDEEYVPAGFAQRPDGSQPILVGDDAIDSLRGRAGTFLPIPDMTIAKATRSEVADYADFTNGYRRQWRATDPVIVSMSSSPAGRADREKVSLGILVTPYARERYDALARYLAPASATRIARLPNDALSMEAGLRDRGQQYQVHVGLQDSEVPYVIREGAIERKAAFESTTYFRRNSYAVVNPSGTDGLRLLSRFTRSLEYGEFDVPSADRPRPRATGDPEMRVAYAAGGLLATTMAGFLESLFVGLSIEDREAWTVMGRGAQIRESVLSRLSLEQVAIPAQMRLRMVDVNETAVAPYINGFTYLESRKVSAANAQLLNLLNQQLNVQPPVAQSEAERLLRARLVCPLGGEYQLLTESAVPYWTSSGWTTKSYYDLNKVPSDYRFPFLDWLRGLDVAFNLTPDTLLANVELEVRQNGIEHAVVRGPDSAEDHATASEKDRKPHTGDRDKRVRRVQAPAEVRPGDTIVILDDQAPLMVGDTVLDALPRNEQLRVVEIRGIWMGVFDQKRDKLIHGWIHVRHVGKRMD